VVGIVLVSHSSSIAEGAAALAREMGGDDVRIAPAGGLDDVGATGTDAMRVLAAIEAVWSDDGVLVLMASRVRARSRMSRIAPGTTGATRLTRPNSRASSAGSRRTISGRASPIPWTGT